MAAKLLPLLLLSLFFISQVSSDLVSNEEANKMFNGRAADRNLVQSIGHLVSKYLNNHAVSGSLSLGLAPSPSPKPHPDCGGLCTYRCSQHSRQNMCMRACGTCCVRCKCVPPGTFGNRELCGKCYTDMTTHRNQTKCP